MHDRHYTPTHIADVLTSAIDINGRRPIAVADFSAGRGALLDAVEKRQTVSRVVATDLDPDAMRELHERRPTWSVGVCDFLNPRSVAASPLVRPTAATVDVALLNPPFSCRGASRVTTSFLGIHVKSSVAMAFVLGALLRVHRGGRVVALLPVGCLTAEKDEHAWRCVRGVASVEVMHHFGRKEFAGAYASTTVVRLTRTNQGHQESLTPSTTQTDPQLTLIRGRLPVHTAQSRGRYRVVHTTDLQESGVALRNATFGPPRLAVERPLLVIPRVGRPYKYKVALLEGSEKIVLSDCLFALSGELDALKAAQQQLFAGWTELADHYVGSCAPYTTIRRLHSVLNRLGVSVALEHRLRERGVLGHNPV